ncbi:c-type cytochrome [Thalassotalea euphylliae]|uniref:c-type cytochrome n=1 Tax=Thalassotalea euphylliae TaxID=1655234 RepID=UPI0036336002
MKKMTLAIATAALMSAPAFAGDVEAGKAKSAMCAACHGAEGVSAIPMYPNLAGQKQAYLAKQLKDFRSGARKDPVMAPMAMGLSDADIDNLSAFYASLKP